MNTPAGRSASTGGTRLERFSKGDKFAVNPDAIERELASLWREAGESTAGHQPVTRACLWNVLIHAEGRKGEEGQDGAGRLADMIRDLPRYLASRALVLRTEAAAKDKPELESWISANCVLAEGGGKVVCSEEITITSYGHGEAHLPGLVRALLVPDVPTAVVFAGVPSDRGHLSSGLLEVADRVIVRADGSSDPAALGKLAGVAKTAHLGAMDLDWIALSPFRMMIAELFEPPADDSEWQSVRKVTVSASKSASASGKLLLGWIAASLGASSPELAGTDAWNLTLERGDRLRLELLRDDAASSLGVREVVLGGGEHKHVVRMVDARSCCVEPRGKPPRTTGVDRPRDAALLATALRSRGEDRGLSKALSIARRL